MKSVTWYAAFSTSNSFECCRLSFQCVKMTQLPKFFAHSVQIKLPFASSCQTMPSFFNWKVENQLCCDSTMDRFKDSPLAERDAKEKRQKPSPRGSPTKDLFLLSPMCSHLSYHHGPLTRVCSTVMIFLLSSIFRGRSPNPRFSKTMMPTSGLPKNI